MLCRIVPARYADEAVVACHPIKVTHPVIKLRNFLQEAGASIATQLYVCKYFSETLHLSVEAY